MPPQVGSAREGTRIVAPQTTDELEQTKSSELEKKPADQQNKTSDTSATQTHRVSPEEKTGKLKELSVRGDTTKATLNNKLKALNAKETLTPKSPDSIRQQGVLQLSKRTYPQDKVPGQMFEIEEIRQSSINKTRTEKNSEYMDLSISTSINKKVADHPKHFREATQSGLKERLSELNGHAPLTDFEKNLVLRFGDSKSTTLTPIKGVDSNGEKIDAEVQAYKVKDGNISTYYDRNGKRLQWGIHNEPLIDRNLGPIDLWPAGQLTKQVGGKIVKKVTEKVVTKEAATVAKAEVSTAVKEAASAGKVEARQGGGTSIYSKPTSPAQKPPTSEFTEAEEKIIKNLQENDMTRKEAEAVIRDTRGKENYIEVVPSGPNSDGYTPQPPVAGKKYR